MLNKIQVVDVRVQEGTAKKTGQPYRIAEAQCILFPSEPGAGMLVGKLQIPKGMDDPEPGEYLAEFRMAQFQDGSLGARLHKLSPVAPKPQAQPAANKPA